MYVCVCRSVILQKIQCLMLCKAEEETVLPMIKRITLLLQGGGSLNV